MSKIDHSNKSVCQRGGDALVSVIMAAYNHEQYIEYAIESVIQQDYQNIELIIVNDGSPDNTHAAIQRSLARCHKRFVRTEYINNSVNQGLQKTLNEAISLTKGDYLFSIGSDDAFVEDAVSSFYHAIKDDDNCGLIVGDNYLIDDSNRRCYWDANQNSVYLESEAAFLSFGDFLRANRPDVDFLSDDFGSYKSYLKGNYMPGGFFLPKYVMTEIGGYQEGQILDDLNLMFKVSKKYRIRFLDRFTYKYRWHSTNTAKQRQHMLQLTLNTFANERHYCMQNPEYKKLWRDYVIALKLDTKQKKWQRSFFKRWYRLTSIFL